MLDRSGSMKGQNWQSLIKAVSNFLSYLENNNDLKNLSKVSVIGYDRVAKVIFTNQEPKIDLVN